MERQGALFTGVCSQDGCSQAPRDGFMASRKKGSLSQNMLLNIRGNQKKIEDDADIPPLQKTVQIDIFCQPGPPLDSVIARGGEPLCPTAKDYVLLCRTNPGKSRV